MTRNVKFGFTLVELLVVMAILGVLVTLVAGGYRSAQFRSRDAQRKSDLKQIVNALELFYSDHGSYPGSSSDNKIQGCPSTTSTACDWGSGEFRDANTTYFRELPQDPGAYRYVYKTNATRSKFQLFARLENSRDKDIIDGITVLCGGVSCNFAVTSANTTATEQI